MKLILIILIFLINFIFSFRNEFYWNEKQILIANDGKADAYFGSVSEIKGNICVIGAYYANTSENQQQGKAYIYENNGTYWNQKQILIANDGEAGDYFGFSVSISNDHKYILISSPFATVENNYKQGKVYIYENNGTFYNLKQLLVPNDGEESDQFGWIISISNDSSFLLIGAPYANVGNNDYQGKVYIFQNNGTFWNLFQILIASDGEEYDHFGSSVSISNDEKYILIGAPQANVNGTIVEGKVYIFKNNGTNWNKYQILIPNDGNQLEKFGINLKIMGNYSLIGAPWGTVGNNTYQGKVYIFENNGTFWNQYQILIANDGKENDQFGFDIAISNDEKFILIGAPLVNVGDNISQGKVYIFQNNGTFWNQYQILIASDGEAHDQFGYSVSISGNYSLIGAPDANFGNNISQGKAYIFDLDSKPNPNPNSKSNSKTKTIYLIIIIFFILIGIFLIIFLIRKTKQKKIQIQIQNQNQNQEEEILMNSSSFSDENENENENDQN